MAAKKTTKAAKWHEDHFGVPRFVGAAKGHTVAFEITPPRR